MSMSGHIPRRPRKPAGGEQDREQDVARWAERVKQQLGTLQKVSLTYLTGGDIGIVMEGVGLVMNISELTRLAVLVAELRAAQRRYFRTKEGLDLCKRLEKELDRMLHGLFQPDESGLFEKGKR